MAADPSSDDQAFVRARRAEYGSPEGLERAIAEGKTPGHPEWEHLIEWAGAEDWLRKKGENPEGSP